MCGFTNAGRRARPGRGGRGRGGRATAWAKVRRYDRRREYGAAAACTAWGGRTTAGGVYADVGCGHAGGAAGGRCTTWRLEKV